MKINFGLLVLFLSTHVFAQTHEVTKVPLLREGTKIIDGVGQLHREGSNQPIVVKLPRKDGKIFDTFIVLPNQRLAEMEASMEENKGQVFRISGDVFAYSNHNYLLIREAVSLVEHADRNHPTTVPVDPSKEALEVEDYDDSIADIVKELEVATGSLVRSIRIASRNPIEQPAVQEGTKVTARRCHLIRNDSGAWISVFVSDATGLSDPPCTLLPSVEFGSLTTWMQKNDPSIPVLLSGELFSYHGHRFLLVGSWRAVHKTDHLDN